MLKRYGLTSHEADVIFDSWQTLLSPHTEFYDLIKRQILSDSLRVIADIEQKRPGIVRWLYRECNIRHFGRYPDALLIQAYDDREKTNTPHMLYVFPHADWNGAFQTDRVTLQEVMRKTSPPYAVRIFETGSAEDFEKSMLKLAEKYGKLDAAIIGGHGNEDSIYFGKSWKQRLHKNETERLRRIFKTCFVYDGKVILFSCSTGKKGGIAQQISYFGIEVQGPDINTAPSYIEVILDKGKIRFIAHYRDAKTRRYFKGKEVT
jgi:hypothetical protein